MLLKVDTCGYRNFSQVWQWFYFYIKLNGQLEDVNIDQDIFGNFSGPYLEHSRRSTMDQFCENS